MTGRKKTEENFLYSKDWKKMALNKIHHFHSATMRTVSERP